MSAAWVAGVLLMLLHMPCISVQSACRLEFRSLRTLSGAVLEGLSAPEHCHWWIQVDQDTYGQ